MKAPFYASPWDVPNSSAKRETSLEEELFEMAAKEGAKKIAAGEVSPEEGLQNFQKFGMQNIAQRLASLNPRFSSQAADATVPGGKKAGGAGTLARNALEMDQKALSNRTQYLYKDPDENTQHTLMAMGMTPQYVEEMVPSEEDPTKMVMARRLLGWQPNPEHPYQIQEQGIRDMQGMLADIAREPAQLDLSPALALVDSWYGTNLQKGYTKPESAQDKRNILLKYADELQQRRAGMSKTVLDGVKSMKAGTQQDLLQALLGEKVIRESGDPNRGSGGGGRPDVKAKGFLTTFRSDDTVKNSTGALTGSRTIGMALRRPNWVKDKLLQADLLKAADLYPISNLDVQSLAGGPGVVSKFEAMLERVKNDKFFRPHDRALIADYVQALAEHHTRVIDELGHTYATTHGPEYGYTPEKALALIKMAMVGQKTGGTSEMYPVKIKKSLRTTPKGQSGKQDAPTRKGLSDKDRAEMERLRAKKRQAGGS